LVKRLTSRYFIFLAANFFKSIISLQMIFFGYKRFILLYADYKFDKRDEDVNQLTYKDCKYIVMNKIQTSTKEKTTNINKHTQRCTHEPVAYTN
jgi:hypothetical protein